MDLKTEISELIVTHKILIQSHTDLLNGYQSLISANQDLITTNQNLITLLTNIKEVKLPTELLTRKEAAKLLGVSLPTLSDWTNTGKIIGYRIASRVRYKSNELENSLSQIQSA
jgi:excisionase family DNA binding protein